MEYINWNYKGTNVKAVLIPCRYGNNGNISLTLIQDIQDAEEKGAPMSTVVPGMPELANASITINIEKLPECPGKDFLAALDVQMFPDVEALVKEYDLGEPYQGQTLRYKDGKDYPVYQMHWAAIEKYMLDDMT